MSICETVPSSQDLVFLLQPDSIWTSMSENLWHSWGNFWNLRINTCGTLVFGRNCATFTKWRTTHLQAFKKGIFFVLFQNERSFLCHRHNFSGHCTDILKEKSNINWYQLWGSFCGYDTTWGSVIILLLKLCIQKFVWSCFARLVSLG